MPGNAGCAGCGDCCRVIAIDSAPEEFAAPPEQVTFLTLPRPTPESTPEEVNAYELDMMSAFGRKHEYAFIRTHFHAVSREEAIAINPRMAAPWLQRKAFYTCDAFDPATSLCTMHDERPDICRDFPWYGIVRPNPIGLGAFARCSYWHDVPRSLWPDGIDPLPDPNARTPQPMSCC